MAEFVLLNDYYYRSFAPAAAATAVSVFFPGTGDSTYQYQVDDCTVTQSGRSVTLTFSGRGYTIISANGRRSDYGSLAINISDLISVKFHIRGWFPINELEYLKIAFEGEPIILGSGGADDSDTTTGDGDTPEDITEAPVTLFGPAITESPGYLLDFTTGGTLPSDFTHTTVSEAGVYTDSSTITMGSGTCDFATVDPTIEYDVLHNYLDYETGFGAGTSFTLARYFTLDIPVSITSLAYPCTYELYLTYSGGSSYFTATINLHYYSGSLSAIADFSEFGSKFTIISELSRITISNSGTMRVVTTSTGMYLYYQDGGGSFTLLGELSADMSDVNIQGFVLRATSDFGVSSNVTSITIGAIDYTINAAVATDASYSECELPALAMEGSGTRYLGANQVHAVLPSLVMGGYQSDNERADLEFPMLTMTGETRWLYTDIEVPMLTMNAGDEINTVELELPAWSCSGTVQYSYVNEQIIFEFDAKSFVQGAPANIANELKPTVLLVDHPDIVEIADLLFEGM